MQIPSCYYKTRAHYLNTWTELCGNRNPSVNTLFELGDFFSAKVERRVKPHYYDVSPAVFLNLRTPWQTGVTTRLCGIEGRLI